jgi:hypothetical protein
MAATLQQLQDRLDALEEAYGNAELEVKYADKSVKYRSLTEIAAAITRTQGQIAALEGAQLTQVGRNRTLASFSKGLNNNNGRNRWGC